MRIIFTSLLTSLAWAQAPQAPQHQHQHQHAEPSKTTTMLPEAPAGGRVKLEDLEKLALEKNPALGQARARVQSAIGRRRQSSLYPNPVVGYSSDEVTPGAIIRGGEHGAFIE